MTKKQYLLAAGFILGVVSIAFLGVMLLIGMVMSWVNWGGFMNPGSWPSWVRAFGLAWAVLMIGGIFHALIFRDQEGASKPMFQRKKKAA